MSYALPNPELLIVDDDRAGAESIARKLALRRFRAEIADDGEAALSRIDARPPDLVLLDAMMPGMDGRQVLSAIRARHSPQELPVVMLTGLIDRTTQKVIFEAGANDFVPKPADIDVLTARINMHLSQRAALHRMQREQARLKRRLEARERLDQDVISDRGDQSDVLRALRLDLEADALSLAYQPKYDLRSGKICGVEALLRWPNPQFSAIAPDHFVALADEGGAIASHTGPFGARSPIKPICRHWAIRSLSRSIFHRRSSATARQRTRCWIMSGRAMAT
jgi:DNA-binding response OmpR family regulator